LTLTEPKRRRHENLGQREVGREGGRELFEKLQKEPPLRAHRIKPAIIAVMKVEQVPPTRAKRPKRAISPQARHKS
jgi:hypothetical protein